MRSMRGFTLVELVVVTAVISIMSILIANFVAGRIKDNAIKNAQADLQLQTQLALDNVNREIQTSANVDGTNRWEDQNPPTTGNPYSWSSDGDTLVLANPTIDTNEQVVFEDPQAYISYKDNIIYFVSGGTLFRRTLAAPVGGNKRSTTCPQEVENCPQDDALLAANIEDFEIHYYDASDNEVTPADARSVAVRLKVSKEIYGRTLEVDETVRSVFRNE